MLLFLTKQFNQLSINELYEILSLRAEVFVVEQNCPYQDLDGKDKKALHVLGMQNNNIVAYARILEKGIAYKNYSAIGRIVTHNSIRGKGYGDHLVRSAIEATKASYPDTSIKISAQAHLEKFYNELGFIFTGEAYLEDNIPHIGMVLKD